MMRSKHDIAMDALLSVRDDMACAFKAWASMSSNNYKGDYGDEIDGYLKEFNRVKAVLYAAICKFMGESNRELDALYGSLSDDSSHICDGCPQADSPDCTGGGNCDWHNCEYVGPEG